MAEFYSAIWQFLLGGLADFSAILQSVGEMCETTFGVRNAGHFIRPYTKIRKKTAIFLQNSSKKCKTVRKLLTTKNNLSVIIPPTLGKLPLFFATNLNELRNEA